jgi:hypothetical protein
VTRFEGASQPAAVLIPRIDDLAAHPSEVSFKRRVIRHLPKIGQLAGVSPTPPVQFALPVP